MRIVGGNKGFGINDGMFANFTIPMWQEVRRHHDPFSGVFAWRTDDVLLGKPSDPHRVHGLEVSGKFFNVLGIAPWQGRLIEPQDEARCELIKGGGELRASGNRRWAARPITANTTIMVDGKHGAGAGRYAARFLRAGCGRSALILRIPPAYLPIRGVRSSHFSVMGRLKPGWSIERASAYFDAMSPGLFESTAPDGYSAETIKMYKSFRLAAYPAGAGVS